MMRLAMGFSMALLLGLGSCASGEVPSGGTYRGRVVDVDTGKPLAGVVVVFIWERHDYSPLTKRITREFHAATEALTDADGRFEVSAAPERTFRASILEVRLEDPLFFAPGYFLPYKGRKENESLVVFLKRAENPRDALEPLPLVPSFPFSRTPLLLKALNAERARLGLPLIQPRAEGGQ